MTYVPDYLACFHGQVYPTAQADTDTVIALNQTVALAAAWCSSLEASLRWLCTEETVTITKREYERLKAERGIGALERQMGSQSQGQLLHGYAGWTHNKR